MIPHKFHYVLHNLYPTAPYCIKCFITLLVVTPPGAHPKIQAIVTSLHPTAPPPRVVYGHEAEVSNILNLNKNGLPTVDDLLRSLRAASEPCTSSDNKPSDTASMSKSSDSTSNTTEEKSLGSSHDSNAFKDDSSNSSSIVSTSINRKCSLSDTEILKTKLECEKPLASSRSFRASSPLRPCRTGSWENFNFRQLKKGSVAEEVLNELQCDSSLLQKTLESNEHYTRDLSDSLDISRTDLDDSLEKRVTVTENAEVAWSETAHHGGQKVPLGTDTSVLSLISNCESSAHVIPEVVERPGILKKPRMGAHRSQRGTSYDTYGDIGKSRNETVKRVRFVDQPSTTEIQTYISKQPSYLSQVPTLQKPTKTLSHRTQYSKSQVSPFADSSTFKYDTGATTLPFSTIDSEQGKSIELHGKMPTDEEINDLWSEIQSYFRAGATVKTRNGMHSTESSGHLGNRTDSSFVAQKGHSPVTHLSVGSTGSRYRQANTRTDILRNEHEGTRRCVSPVQITFGSSSLRTKEATKSSGIFLNMIIQFAPQFCCSVIEITTYT